MRLLTVLLTAIAVPLLMPPPRAGPGRPRGAALRTTSGRLWHAIGFGGVGAVLLVYVDGARLALALIGLGCAAAVTMLVGRSRRARVAEARQALVVEVCEALVGELRAGQPLVTSLQHCVEVWSAFEPVAAASRLGADVPSALRRLSALTGAEGLREIASAWQVAEQSGAGLATALAQVAVTARERQATRHLVKGELASAQATARLIVVLPVASLAMSAGIGGNPWHFLLGTPVGLTCLGGGALLAWLGLLWIDRIAAAVLTG
jgi:tight adherence protein B